MGNPKQYQCSAKIPQTAEAIQIQPLDMDVVEPILEAEIAGQSLNVVQDFSPKITHPEPPVFVKQNYSGQQSIPLLVLLLLQDLKHVL